MKVFVSGAAGVIGRQLVIQLLDKGYEVTGGDTKPRPNEFPDSVTYVEGDLNELNQKQWDLISPSIFFHLAATFQRTSESVEYWPDWFENNIQLSHHLITLARNGKGLSRVVFASSYLIYNSDKYMLGGNQSPLVLSENETTDPRNLIGLAKLLHERELDFLQATGNVAFTSVSARIFRGFGLGSRDVISRWIRALLADEKIEVYDDQGSFDFTYCKDAASGLLALGTSTNYSGVVNVSSGVSTKIKDVVLMLLEIFPEGKVVSRGSRDTVERSNGNLSLIESLTGWKPAYSLSSALKEIAEYESTRLE